MDWLNNAATSNRLRQTYVSGFMDVSGGSVIVRNGDLLAYGNVILGGNTSIINIIGTASFEKAPIMDGTNIIPGTIPPSAIGGGSSGGGGGGSSFSFVDTGSNQSVAGNKTFTGDVSMNRNVGIGNGASSVVRVNAGSITVGTAGTQIITVGGTTTFASNPSITGNGIVLDSSSNQTISGVKSFIGDASLTGNVILGNTIRSVTIGGNTIVARGITIQGDLSMTNAIGLLSLNGNVSMINSSRILTVAGTSNLNGNVNIARDLTVTGNSRIDGSLNVINGTTIGGVLNANGNVVLGDNATDIVTVNGTTTFGNAITATKNVTIEGITYSGSHVIRGNIDSSFILTTGPAVSFLGDTTFGNTDATSNFESTVYSYGDSYLWGDLVQIGQSYVPSKLLEVYYNSTFRSDISVLGNITSYGNCTIGDTVSDILTVNSRSVMQGNVRFNQDVSLCNNVFLGDNSLNRILIKGNTTFENAPTMSGANITSQTIPQSSISGGSVGFVDLNTTQTISGNKTFTGDMSMVGNIVLGDTQDDNIKIRGTTVFDRPPTMSGANIETNTIPVISIVGGVNGIMDLSTNQIARGWKTFQDDVSLCRNVLLGDNSSNTIKIVGTATFDIPPFMSGANITDASIPVSAINGPLDGSFVDLSSNQSIAGGKTFTSDVSMNSNVYLSDTSYVVIVKGKTKFISDVSINGNIWLGDSSSDFITMIGTTIFNGDASFNGSIQLGDASNDIITFVGKPIFDRDLSLNGNVQLGDASNDTLVVVGKSTFNSDMVINGNLNLNGGLQIGRIRQIIGGDLSGNYSGFYRLGKNTYPAIARSEPIQTINKWNMILLGNEITDNVGKIAWSSFDKIFAVGSLTQSRIWTSTDGITWTQRTISSGDTNSRWTSVISRPTGGFFAFSNSGSTRAAYSANGTSWSVVGPGSFSSISTSHNWTNSVYVEDLLKVFTVANNTGSVVNFRIGIYDLNTQSWDYKEYNETSNDNALNAIEWAGELNTLCVVGTGVISISTNGGTTWGTTLADSTYVFNSICWCSDLGLFIVCGHKIISGSNYACVLVSSNGSIWTQTYIHPNPSTTFTSCCWSDEMKNITVAGNAILVYSFDAVKWTFITHSYSATLNSIIWSKETGLFMITGEYVSAGVGNSGQIAITNLNIRPLTSHNMFQHTYNRIDQSGNWYFQKMGISGTGVIQDGFQFDVSGNGIIHGNTVLGDASNFTLKIGGKSQFLTDASFESGNVYLGGDNIIIGSITNSRGVIQSNKRIYQSLSSDSSYSLYNGYYGLAKDAMPTYGPAYASGVLGGTWTNRYTVSSATACGVYWNPTNKAIFMVTGLGYILYSTNGGISFGLTNNAGVSAGAWNSCAYSPRLNIGVAVSSSGTTRAVYMSGTGYSANNATTGPSSVSPWNSVIWVDELGLFIAVSSTTSSTGAIAYSSNGNSWTTINPFSTVTPLLSICWSPELRLLCAVGFSGSSNKSIATSTNATTWTKISISHNLYSICWSSKMGMFVAVGENIIYYSRDGVNWSTITTTYTLRGVIWVDHYSMFVATTIGSTSMYYSFDGLIWNSVTGVSGFGIFWADELGLFISSSSSQVNTSDLQLRHPTYYNIFNSRNTFNNIDQNGNWSFKSLSVKTAGGTSSGYYNLYDVNNFSSEIGRIYGTGNGIVYDGAYNSSIKHIFYTKDACDNTITSLELTAARNNIYTYINVYKDITVLNGHGIVVSGPITVAKGNTGTDTAVGSTSNFGGRINAYSFNATSDYRLKTSIGPLDSQIDTILSLEPKSFVWKNDGRHDIGFIAQDVLKKFPHLRGDGLEGDEPVDASGNPQYLTFDYSKLTPYLWKGLQELIGVVNTQKKDIQDLIDIVKIQNREIEELKQKLGKIML